MSKTSSPEITASPEASVNESLRDSADTEAQSADDFRGLSSAEVTALQAQYGKNELASDKKPNFFIKILHIISEPMFLLLLAAATIYFILGEPSDGVVMLIFIVGIITIDTVQEWKTDKTLEALKNLSAPKITALRNGEKVEIDSRELVPGDIIYLYEGVKIPADGIILECSGLRVDESSLTGESENVWKTTHSATAQLSDESSGGPWRTDYCYQGTLVTGGTAIIKVEQTGSRTEYGKIGLSISEHHEVKTPLQRQTDRLVKYSAFLAFGLFLAVSLLTFFQLADYAIEERAIDSILAGVTLAMAMIPEEFPVVLTVFLSLGAWRLAKKHSLVKKLSAVETLGAVSVLCVDKTGTITKNQMEVAKTFRLHGDETELARVMCLSSEPETYDPMEKAMFAYAKTLGLAKKPLFAIPKIKTYPFTDGAKMMGAAYEDGEGILLAVKGSPENVLKLVELSTAERAKIDTEITILQKQGLRVIAIASSHYQTADDLSESLSATKLRLNGLVGLMDPPRENIYHDLEICKRAGVRVVMITGDNGVTAATIARQIGMAHADDIITGEMLERMSFEELRERVKTVSIFSRVVPEHKMRIVKAFQANGEVVAMTGDGVNDAPALTQAEIGIAMGGRGSEVSREAADLILLDDNFTTIVDTIRDGRRIYDNIRKAIEYILVIHVPIALSALFGPLLGISPSDLLFLPIHIVIMELMIDPTSSIVFERQPAESDLMDRPPRDASENIVNRRTLLKSIFQGLAIFAGSFGSYYHLLQTTNNAPLARTIALVILILSNLFLVLINSSDRDPLYKTIGKILKDKVLLITIFALLAAIAVLVYSPLNSFLKLTSLSLAELFGSILIAISCTFWYEIVKFVRLQLK